MRKELLYNPRLLLERLAVASQRKRRFDKLKGTAAKNLSLGHIDSLELLELAKSHNPKVIYDIGANIGTWSLLAKAIFPDVTIHAFEPLIMHHEPFNKEVAGISDIVLHKVAAGPETAKMNIQVTSFSDASSLLETSEAIHEHFGITTEREETIEVVKLDDYVTTNSLPFPDLIKLDIQGYELEALRGAQQCMNHAQFILCEVSFLEFYQGQPLFHEIIEFMSQKGFYLYSLSINTPAGKKLVQTDALFYRSED